MTTARFGVWRPLGPETEPAITPTVLIFHTMVGYLKSTENMFKVNGYQGVESTFGLGGPWDGAEFDGALWQWQDIYHQADAQFAGNAYANSVETSDGGNATRPWSDKQVDTLIKLVVWWCTTTKNPCKLVAHPTDKGLGYHRQFEVWNTENHSCPGDARLKQLLTVIIPKARAILAGEADKPSPFRPQHWLKQGDHGWDVEVLQRTLNKAGTYRLRVDGDFGDKTDNAVRDFQKKHHLSADGVVGPNTSKALWG